MGKSGWEGKRVPNPALTHRLCSPLHCQQLHTYRKAKGILGRVRCNVSDLDLTLCLGSNLHFTQYFYVNFICICSVDFFFFFT